MLQFGILECYIFCLLRMLHFAVLECYNLPFQNVTLHHFRMLHFASSLSHAVENPDDDSHRGRDAEDPGSSAGES